MFIGHRFLINIFLIFFSTCISAESNQIDEISDIEGVFLDFNYPDKKVQMIADRTFILSDEVFELQGVSITSESADKTLNINSSIATYDQSSNKIYMEDSVKFVTKFKDKQIFITSEKLQYDIHDENLRGYERSIVTFNDPNWFIVSVYDCQGIDFIGLHYFKSINSQTILRDSFCFFCHKL